jgi:sialate O-acetylesterase
MMMSELTPVTVLVGAFRDRTKRIVCEPRGLCWMVALVASVFNPFGSVRAEVKLPAIFSDHMVLQREMKVPIWGWADPGENVTVTIAEQKQTTTADDKGHWRVTLDPLSSDEPQTMAVEGKNRVEVKDVLVGEVWICSGQSNMEYKVKDCWNGDLDVASAKYPNIRFVSVKGPGSQTTVEDFHGQWNVCSPKTVGDFSAVGYFFGRELHEQLGVPIGLIDNSWGGSTCEAWIRRDRLEGNPLFQPTLEANDKGAADPNAKAVFDRNFAEWDKLAAEARQAGDPEPPGRPWWVDPLTGQFRAANLYHGRIEPIMPFAIRGVIWYQGESNAGRALQYRDMFPLLIKSWREDWGLGDFPFYWVQLANFGAQRPEPSESGWAELRDAQTMTLDRLPNTGQAVIIDLGEAADIHPRDKLDVAKRLVRWALARDYGRDIPYESPRYDSIEKKGGTIVVHFKDVGGGLRTVNAHELQGFAITGEDQKWFWADAKIVDTDQVQVRSDKVAAPVAVRYAWADNPVCNLYNTAGLPVTPFRTDDGSETSRDAR